MIIGREVRRVETCSNSMELAKKHMNAVPDGTVFFVDNLQNAYGRQGRVWQIRPGQLILTIVLKPDSLRQISKDDLGIRLNQLNMALATGIVKPLLPYDCILKWPNDFISTKDHKKIGGMLFHVVWRDEVCPQGVVLGFALNVNTQFDRDDTVYPIATSLKENAGVSVVMKTLYNQLLESMNSFYCLWGQGLYSQVFNEWKKYQSFYKKRIEIHNKGGFVLSGTLDQLLPSGDIILKNDAGRSQIISFHMVENVFHTKS